MAKAHSQAILHSAQCMNKRTALSPCNKKEPGILRSNKNKMAVLFTQCRVQVENPLEKEFRTVKLFHLDHQRV